MGKTQKITIGLIIAMLLMGTLGMVCVPRDGQASNAQPQLVALAKDFPGQFVRVIAQKVDTTDRAEALVAQLGGKVTKDLHIINAFGAELTAKSAVALAQSGTVRWVSLDGVVESTGKPVRDTDPSEPLPENYYLDTLGVRQVWEMGYRGEGVGVAVIDSGVFMDRDFTEDPKRPHTRVVVQKSFNSETPSDEFGHGTLVAGIIGGHGGASDGLYAGIAPGVTLINLKIMDDYGMAYESDTVAALQWVFENKEAYNIRVVNLSIQSTLEQSYHTSPLDAAAEILWFNGVVVVASAGNYQPDSEINPILAAPANDPFIITVGAVDENDTANRGDDFLAPFSAEDDTLSVSRKPEVLAPGHDIINVLSSSSSWRFEHPERVVLDGEYIRLSGTSLAAPMVAGAAALLVQAEPDLTPDQVKYRLTSTGSTINDCKYLDVFTAITTPTTESANTGIEASQLLWTGDEPVVWGSVAWNSVAWNSVAWNSVAWNSVAWNSVAWNSVAWND